MGLGSAYHARMRSAPRVCLLGLLAAAACDDSTAGVGDAYRDAGRSLLDGGARDAGGGGEQAPSADATAGADAPAAADATAGADAPAAADATMAADATVAADAPPADAPSADATVAADAAVADAAPADAAAPDSTAPAGLSTPCASGPGWALFRFHYGGASKSPSIDVWDATCSYSYAPNSACNVYAVYPGFGDVSYTAQGYPILTSSEYLRVRFSVAGLSFASAAVYVQARSYATSASTYFEVWSPLHGGVEGGPVDNDWTYDWYGVDWTGYLTPADQPALTAIQIYAGRGSGQLAVSAVELCVQ